VRTDERVTLADETGCQSVCLFLERMEVLPRMPQFALIGDTAERRETRRRCVRNDAHLSDAGPPR